MYITINIRKYVKNQSDANNFLDIVRDKMSDQKEIELAAQYVAKLCHETPNPCPQPTEGDQI